MNAQNISNMNWNMTCWNDDPTISFPAKNSIPGLCATTAQTTPFDRDVWVQANYGLENALTSFLAVGNDVDTNLLDSDLSRNGHSTKFVGHYPTDYVGSTKCNASFLQAWSYDHFCAPALAAAINNHRVAHEIGHLVHMRALGYGGVLSGGSCGPSNSWTAVEGEKCTASEGWANFFATAMHFTSVATAPFYNVTSQQVEGYTSQGNQYPDKCVAYHANPWIAHRTEGNVTRWFWDLFDNTTNGDDGQDNATLNLSYLIARWDLFNYGTGNRETHESGDSGRNAWDYEFHFNSTLQEPELHQNCLSNQCTGYCP